MEDLQWWNFPSLNWRTALEGSIPVIAGCTATGKTSAALEMARRFPGTEIVSADSRQFYRGMDIGTAKPSSEELGTVPHHMINVADPDALLSAGWYAAEASRIINEILCRGGTPLVVGGSALYIMSLAGLFDELPERNDKIREALKDLEDQVPGSLHRILSGIDTDEAERIGASDTVRLVRSIEIGLLSGEKPSHLKRGGTPDRRFRFVVLDLDGETLRSRIERRSAEMIRDGLKNEVQALLDKGYRREPVLGATIGYAEMMDHIQGLCTVEEAESRIAVNTWRYARRQRNMFRRLPGAVYTGNSPDRIADILFRERIANG